MSTEASPATDTLEPTVDAPAPAEAIAETPTEIPSDASATSSSADISDAKTETPGNLLDVVKSVVEKTPASDASSATAAKQDPPTPEAPAAEGAEKTDAELPFHNHPRWKERNEELKSLRTENESLKAPAENYRQITEYMQAQSLSPAEVGEGFEVMGWLKSSDLPTLAKARDWFADRLQALNGYLGDTLPADLQEKVASGLVDEEIARELARTRASSKHLETSQADRRERDQQQEQRQSATRLQETVAGAVNAWEVRTRASDPDYAMKAELIETTARAIVHRTGRPPQSEADAVALADAAYAEVNKHLKVFAPRPRPVTPAPSGMSASVAAAPKSFAEAIRFAVRK